MVLLSSLNNNGSLERIIQSYSSVLSQISKVGWYSIPVFSWVIIPLKRSSLITLERETVIVLDVLFSSEGKGLLGSDNLYH
jgi:hypothetical protein